MNKKSEQRIYEGLHPSYPILTEAQESLSTFPKEFLPCPASELEAALKSPVNVEQIRKGESVSIHTGWQGHAVYLFFSQGYLVICNRGERPDKTPTIEAFKINPDRIPDDLIEAIHRSKAENNAQEGMLYIHRTLPSLLGAEKDDLCKTIETLSNKQQTVGNCPMTVKSVLRVASFFILHKKGIPKAEALKISRDFSKTWSTYFRLLNFSRYLDDKTRLEHFNEKDTEKTTYIFPKRDEYLMQQALKKLHKRKDFKTLLSYFPNVLAYKNTSK